METAGPLWLWLRLRDWEARLYPSLRQGRCWMTHQEATEPAVTTRRTQCSADRERWTANARQHSRVSCAQVH